MGCVPFQRWLVPEERVASGAAPPGLELTDDLTLADVAQLSAWLEAQPDAERAQLDLSAADVPDGLVMAALTRALARRLDTGGALHLEGPPQLVLHNLYRIGRYPHILLSVSNERHDEAYG